MHLHPKSPQRLNAGVFVLIFFLCSFFFPPPTVRAKPTARWLCCLFEYDQLSYTIPASVSPVIFTFPVETTNSHKPGKPIFDECYSMGLVKQKWCRSEALNSSVHIMFQLTYIFFFRIGVLKLNVWQTLQQISSTQFRGVSAASGLFFSLADILKEVCRGRKYLYAL